MTASNRTILVLWGHSFDEIAASIFVCELRRLGKRVKLVGLKHQHIAGQYGLTLVPDLSLGQALQAGTQTHCIIVPAPLAALRQFSYDPRLAELLQLAMANQVLFLTAALSADHYPLQTNSLPASTTLQLMTYPATEELVAFVKTELGPRLLGN